MNSAAPDDRVVSVAVAAPLFRLFDYRLPAGIRPACGSRVRVPFGRGQRIGFLVPRPARAEPHDGELKQVLEVIDDEPLFDARLFQLLRWSADYYRHPPGEVFESALPVRLRRRLAAPEPARTWRLAAPIDDVLRALPANATRQRLAARALAAAGDVPVEAAELRQAAGDCAEALRRLADRGLVKCASPEPAPARDGPTLNQHQQAAVERIDDACAAFACFLVRGVTGSGKTEVYLQCARRAIERGRQVLVLVPEIALTPQLVGRFRERLGRPVAVMHSGLPDGERQRAWLNASRGTADVILGTRSAVFAPLRRPGLIIVDEEHDASFKQQEGFRYHARDVAIKRASLENVPVVLGSATPSLESFDNARRGRYHLLELPERAGASGLPDVRLVDTGKWPLTDGLSAPLVGAIARRIERGEQSLIFINRRGFAPVVMCGQCQWQAHCERCDALLTLHRREGMMRCHHCGLTRAAVDACPACGSDDIFFAGVGTQRVEQALARRFPAARILRIDRDTSAARGALESQLDKVRAGEVDILVGTQLLSKGHDFPGITLVGVIGADQGMYSVDFRAPERLFQLVTQVGGRAGRADKPGLVLMQTRFLDHPCMDAIRRHDFDAFAEAELAARRTLSMPPFGCLALVRAESAAADTALAFLRLVRDRAMASKAGEDVEVMDPVPAPMERRAGRFRAQLLVQSRRRPPLRRLLTAVVGAIEAEPVSRRVRWSVDVDPVDLY